MVGGFHERDSRPRLFGLLLEAVTTEHGPFPCGLEGDGCAIAALGALDSVLNSPLSVRCSGFALLEVFVGSTCAPDPECLSRDHPIVFLLYEAIGALS